MLQFHEMGLDDRLLKAIASLGWKSPTLIQERAIPLILEGKDVMVKARTGSGKTGAFALPVLQKILTIKASALKQATRALVLAPSKELCHQIAKNFGELCSSCTRDVKIIDISHQQGDVNSIKSILNERQDIIIATPSRVLAHLQAKNLDLKETLEMLVVDEADLVFSFGYEKDLKTILGFLPSVCQCILASATLSSDVNELKSLLMHNPIILKLKEQPIPPSIQLAHYIIRAEEEDKFVLIYSLLKLNLVRGKSLIFVNTVDRSYKLKLYLEQFGIKSCVLNSELPQMSRWHTVQQFNIGAYNIIIASDDRNLDEKEPEPELEVKEEEAEQSTSSKAGGKKPVGRQKDKESGVSRGIDFQFVSNVINFDFPLDSSSYLHRVGRTARGNNQGSALSFVNIKEEPLLEEVEKSLQELSGESDLKMKPFNFKMEEVEGFRYRAKDAWRSVTRIAIREARLKEIRMEIVNSKKLAGYFEQNPNELKALRHDKKTHVVKIQPQLKNVPGYIIPKSLKNNTGVRRYFSGSLEAPQSSGRPFSRNKPRGGGGGKKRKGDPLRSLEFGGFKKKKKNRK